MRTMVLVGLLLAGSVALAQDCDLYHEVARDAMAYKQAGVEPDDAVRRLMVRFDDEYFDLVAWMVIETRRAPEVSPQEWGEAMRDRCRERKEGREDS